MQVVVGSAGAWQLPLDVVALEWKAELLRYAGFDLLAGLHQGWEMHLLASGLQRSPSLYQRELLAGAASRRFLLSRLPSEVWMRTDLGAS